MIDNTRMFNPSEELLSKTVDQEVLNYMEEYVPVDNQTAILSTNNPFNVDSLKSPEFDGNYPKNLINLSKINDIRDIDDFFFKVNSKLPEKGKFIGCFEPKNLRKFRILKKYPFPINWVYYFFDFLFKRMFPKLPLLSKIYFFITLGRNRVLTTVETFGRIYYSGFKLVDHREINNKIYFVAEKNKIPDKSCAPSYGPLCKLTRNGKGGKPISVYKIRTMHAYSEFLQEYIYEKNKLKEGGKFKNDYRVSNTGKFLRIFWLDELPMLLNLLKGDLKLVGVRPLSSHYLSLYSETLKEKRAQVKPGLIPPFYADLPKNLEEIMESELRYLESYEKHPIKTDFIYLFRIARNIILKKAKSS
jgi:lipopolysaccharide/colanic/teichoic acid biosynthesis glycosyltransferase